MNKSEVARLMAIIQASFPNYKPPSKELMVNVWGKMLEDYTYKQCEMALTVYIRTETSGFAPSVGQLINLISAPEDMAYPTEQEAWSLVSKACSNGNYGYREEFEKLPAVVKKAVGNERNIHEWAAVPLDEFQTVIQSNFLRSYRATLKQEKEFKKYPKEYKALIEQTTQKLIGQEASHV